MNQHNFKCRFRLAETNTQSVINVPEIFTVIVLANSYGDAREKLTLFYKEQYGIEITIINVLPIPDIFEIG